MIKELQSIQSLEFQDLSKVYLSVNKQLNLIPLFDYLKTNTSLKHAAIRYMGLCESSYDLENLCNVLLYNETLVSLSLSHNSISKLTPLMTNLVRNRMSNLLELDLSYNQIDIDEFVGMMDKNNMSKESAFGNLHFKLRILNL